MSEEIFHGIGVRKASVITCKRNGHVDHLKENDSDHTAMNDHTEKECINIPVDGFPNSMRLPSHEMGPSSSGLKRHKSSHHEHGAKHHRKQSHHHHKRNNSSHVSSEQKRFCRTASALKQAGLLELTLQTAQLIQENENLQKEIDSLQKQTLEFSKSLQVQLEKKVSQANRPQNGFT